MTKRLLAVSSILGVIAAALLTAPPAQAAPPTDVTIDSVIAGDRIAYAQWSATGADDYDYAIYTVETGGTPFLFSSSSIPIPYYAFISDSLSNGVEYWLEITANNSSGSTTSTRTAFTMTATPEAGAGTVTSLSTNGYDGGAQYYVSTSGSMVGLLYALFTTSSGWTIRVQNAAPTNGPPAAYAPFSVTPSAPGLTNGTEYFWSAIPVTATGFGTWATRLSVTPAATAQFPVLSNNPPGALSATISWTTPDVATGKSISGYQVDYTTDGGQNWITAEADTGLVNTYTATGLSASETYVFRVAALVDGTPGGWSNASAQLQPTKNTATVTWAPTNTSALYTTGSITPNSLATTDSNGAISYSIDSGGSTSSANCQVNSTTAVLTFSGAGTCTVKATATETSTYAEGTKSVSFTLTAPAPAPAPPSGGGSSSGGTAPATDPAPTTEAPAPPAASAPSAPAPVVPAEIPDPAAVTAEQVETITPAQFALISPEVFQQLPAAAVAALTPEQGSALTVAQVNTIRPAKARELQPATVAALEPAQIAALRPASVARLQPEAIAALSGTQLEALRPAAVRRLTTPQLKALSPDQITALDREQLRTMTPVQFKRLRPATVAALEPAQVRALTKADVRRLRTAQVEALTSEQLASMRLAQLRAFRDSQSAALTDGQLADLSPAQRRALGI